MREWLELAPNRASHEKPIINDDAAPYARRAPRWTTQMASFPHAAANEGPVNVICRCASDSQSLHQKGLALSGMIIGAITLLFVDGELVRFQKQERFDTVGECEAVMQLERAKIAASYGAFLSAASCTFAGMSL